MRTLALLLLATAWGSTVQAQPWSGVLAPSRAIDWSTAGVSGGIPARTTICQTLSPGATAAQINSAIASCPSGQVVKLNPGTYNLSSGIMIRGKTNVTLRGAGPDATFLVFSGKVGCVWDTLICVVNNDSINPLPPQQTAAWSAGYAKGTTSITLSSKTNLDVGDIIFLDQLNDSNTDNGNLWVCANGPSDSIPGTPYCAIEGDSEISRFNRSQVQAVEVTSISGTGPYTIGVKPGLFMPNWRASQSPAAWWMNSVASGNGVEDLSVINNGAQSGSNISFGNVRDSWIKNVRSVNAERSHVLLYGALRATIRDSYFFGVQHAGSQSYGIETNLSSSFLVENNIFHHVTSAMTMGQAAEGSVWAYNFAIDSWYCASPGWMQASSYHHTAGIAYTLFEGNDGIGFTADAIHGTTHFMTAFRNHWPGYDPKGCSVSGKTAQTIPIHIYANNRYFNIVGNVLGSAIRNHTNYEGFAASAGTPGPDPGANRSIYMLGWSGNQEKDSNVANDPLVRTTLLRWGNHDYVTGTRFNGSEVPSGLSLYMNPVPPNTTLPSSFYLSAKPSWFGSIAWPSVGPDVAGVTGPGNKVIKIPARVCFETVMGGTGTETSPLNFNASNCYAGGAQLPAPSNLRVL
jgi:hypothetical protein